VNESPTPDEERTPCDYCGTPVPELWFGLEVTRPYPTSDGEISRFNREYVDLIFCNQQHAALWMQTALPALDPIAPDGDPVWHPHANDRFFWPLVITGAVILGGLVAVGAFTLLRQIFGL